MNIIEKLKNDRKFLILTVGFILLTFVIPYVTIPVLALWWFYKRSKFSKKFKIIATSSAGGLLGVLIIWFSIAYANDAQPYLTVTEPTTLTTTVQAQQITIKGTYSPGDRTIWINGQHITASNGTFDTTYQLKLGENKIDVSAGNIKRVHAYLVVTRELTEEEKAARITPTVTPKRTSTPSPIPTVSSTKATPTQTSTPKQQNTPTPTSTAQPTKQVSIMDQLWTILDRTIKTRSGYDIQYDQTAKEVTVIHTATTFFNETSMVKGGYSTLVKYGTEAFKVNGIDKVKIVIRTEFTDQYGKKEIEDAMRISMTKEEFNKYDWNNLQYQPIYRQMDNSADEHYIHPAILKNLKISDLKLWL